MRFVAGADEAGRGSLAGPLVVAGVLLDYAALHGQRVRPLALLNDSKQVDPDVARGAATARSSAARRRSRCASSPPCEIDRRRPPPLEPAGLRAVLADLAPRADVVPRRRLPARPARAAHRAVVDGDTKSAAIAAASIVAKVTRDRIMRRLDSLYPRYGFSRHVGYITPVHAAAVRAHGPCEQHRISYAAKCYALASRAEPAAA